MNTTAPSKTAQILPRRTVLSSRSYDAPPEGRLDAVRLDFNESTSPVSDCYRSCGMPPSWISSYPEYGKLVERLSARLDFVRDCILLTNGSDEAISLIANTFVEPGVDGALISNPCFFTIKNCLNLAGAAVTEVSVLDNLEFDLAGIEDGLKQNPKLAMFASPENPTGSTIATETIERWCSQFPDVLFVIDEAYGEYAGTTVIPLAKRFQNLLVLKTFSKAWGMAGLRLGMIVGNAKLIEFVNRVRLPYSVNSAAVFTALQLIENEPAMLARVDETVKQRNRLAESMKKRNYSVRETNTNWCLLGAGIQAADLTNFARQRNVLVRNRSAAVFPLQFLADASPAQLKRDAMWGLVRVSTGNDDEMSVFESVIDEYRNNFGLIFDLDGTLVDTSKSFDQTVASLVKQYSGKELDSNDLFSLRREGGYNDDWVAARELLKRRGVDIELEEIRKAGTEYYLSIAADTEQLLLPEALLEKLSIRNRLFIVTGRTRREYAPIWGERFSPYFERVYCVDDIADLAPKPSSDYLLRLCSDFGIKSGAYIGNSVDDMLAARAAQLIAIGIASEADRAAIAKAGAQAILSNCAEIAQLLMLP